MGKCLLDTKLTGTKVSTPLEFYVVQDNVRSLLGLESYLDLELVTLNSKVASRLRRRAECRLSCRVHVESEDGYVAMRLGRKPRLCSRVATLFPSNISQERGEVLTNA